MKRACCRRKYFWKCKAYLYIWGTKYWLTNYWLTNYNFKFYLKYGRYNQ